MTAFNAVRFRVKPGREQRSLDAHAKVQRNWPGLLHANIIETGERTYCIIAEWVDMNFARKRAAEHDRDFSIPSATRSKILAAVWVSLTRYRGQWCF